MILSIRTKRRVLRFWRHVWHSQLPVVAAVVALAMLFTYAANATSRKEDFFTWSRIDRETFIMGYLAAHIDANAWAVAKGKPQYMDCRNLTMIEAAQMMIIAMRHDKSDNIVIARTKAFRSVCGKSK